MKIPKFTIYAKESGVEISPAEKKQNGKPDEGRIALRFFRMATGSHQIRFVVEPREGFDLYRKIAQVQAEGGKEGLTHKFDAGEGETVTKLSVECYERNGKKGYALSIHRGEESINVSASASDFLFAGEFLKHLALTQSWVQQAERSSEKS